VAATRSIKPIICCTFDIKFDSIYLAAVPFGQRLFLAKKKKENTPLPLRHPKNVSVIAGVWQ